MRLGGGVGGWRWACFPTDWSVVNGWVGVVLRILFLEQGLNGWMDGWMDAAGSAAAVAKARANSCTYTVVYTRGHVWGLFVDGRPRAMVGRCG